MTEESIETGYLDGKLLVAMPTMSDPRFERAVILLCAHSESGAMGILLNKTLDALSFAELLEQLDIPEVGDASQIKVHFGGPVDTERGFVVHSTDLLHETTLVIGEDMALTATIDMLKSIAKGTGPDNSFLALGYAGWGPGQLEQEIQQNGWLVVSSDRDIVFGAALDQKWQAAVTKLGVDPALLSGDIGHA
ncbi:MAG: YqgE/AlgH family protein [Sneathiella sp.]|uniref:YqgE/AlgH family protein n=1 Tax=Sneathiella sp. TaxID=1964365 RepID=UPI0030039821